MKIKLIKEVLNSYNPTSEYSKTQLKSILKEINNIVNPSLYGMKIKVDEDFNGMFKLVESEIPNKKIKSISFPDLNNEQRINRYGNDSLPITFELQNGELYGILCQKGKLIFNESELSQDEINDAVELGK